MFDSNGHLVSGQPGCYNVPNKCTSSVAMGQGLDSAATFKFKGKLIFPCAPQGVYKSPSWDPRMLPSGSAIYIHSLLFNQSPLYNITLDGTSTSIDGVIPSKTFDCRTLYWKTGLDPNVKHIIRLSVAGLSPNRANPSPSNNLTAFSLIDFVWASYFFSSFYFWF